MGTEMQLYIYAGICWYILPPLGLVLRAHRLLLGLSSLSAQDSFGSGLSLLPPSPSAASTSQSYPGHIVWPCPTPTLKIAKNWSQKWRDQSFGIFLVISPILGKYGNSWWQWSLVMINDDDVLIKSRGSRFSVPFTPLFYPFPPLLCFGFCYCFLFLLLFLFCLMILYVYSMSLHS